MDDFKKIISDFGRKANKAAADAKDWILENKNVSIPAGIGILILAAVCIATGLKSGKQETAAQSSGTWGVIPVPEVALEENSNQELNALFADYYEALAVGDVEQIGQLKDYVGDAEKIAISKRSEYIDNYKNMSCYTKPGPLEDSYVVYVYTEAKMTGFDTLAPSLKTFLVYRGDSGSYRIMSGEIDENLDNYMIQISTQADVEELFNKVEVKYAEMEDADAELKVFLENLKGIVDTHVAEEIAKKEGSKPEVTEETQDGTEAETEETEPAEPEQQPTADVVQKVAATDVVNIRTSDSETADKLGKAQIGDTFVLLENRENGWSKIQFEGRDAFIKTEFLEVVSEETAEKEPAAEITQDTAGSQSSGETVTAKTTVNIRASANENGERLGTIYQGEKLEVIMKQADGWTKVKYQGKTAYVKSEFVE